MAQLWNSLEKVGIDWKTLVLKKNPSVVVGIV
jgi:hypothetical protein